jgi:hypothetical protein
MSVYGWPMKRWGVCAIIAAQLFIIPETVFAASSELTAGIGSQDPSGDFSYKGDSLEVKEAKVEILWALANPYFMVTRTKFEGEGNKNDQFILNNETFQTIFPFMSRMRFDQHDIVLYHGSKKATAGKVDIDSVAAKIIHRETVIDHQPDAGVNEAKRLTVADPRVCVGFHSP